MTSTVVIPEQKTNKQTCSALVTEDLLVVLITGVSRGIGLGLAEFFLQQRSSYYVICTCRTPSKAHELQKLVSNFATRARLVKLDITDEQSLHSAYKIISRDFKQIDILINNAAERTAKHPHESVLEFDANEMLQMFNTNVIGTASVTKMFFNLLKRAKNEKYSKVVNITSSLSSFDKLMSEMQAGSKKVLTCTSYRMTKVSINMLTCMQAGELSEKHNILFMSLDPGWVRRRKANSHNSKAPMSVEQCAEKMIPMIESLEMNKHNGKFFNLHGHVMKW